VKIIKQEQKVGKKEKGSSFTFQSCHIVVDNQQNCASIFLQEPFDGQNEPRQKNVSFLGKILK
jgi:hypothetical protein